MAIDSASMSSYRSRICTLIDTIIATNILEAQLMHYLEFPGGIFVWERFPLYQVVSNNLQQNKVKIAGIYTNASIGTSPFGSVCVATSSARSTSVYSGLNGSSSTFENMPSDACFALYLLTFPSNLRSPCSSFSNVAHSACR